MNNILLRMVFAFILAFRLLNPTPPGLGYFLSPLQIISRDKANKGPPHVL